MVFLPAPPGPDNTKMLMGPADPSRPAELELGEALEQLLALVLAEALHPAGVADADLLHEAAGLDLAHAGKRFQHGHDLHLADHLVALALVEQLAQGDRP